MNTKIFKISRTTIWDDDIKPCEEAFESKFEYWDTRSINSEEEYNACFEDKWRDRGTSHSITNEGYITRRLEDQKEFAIEINSLEDLINLSKKYGQLIIDADENSIEIYDEYRE